MIFILYILQVVAIYQILKLIIKSQNKQDKWQNKYFSQKK